MEASVIRIAYTENSNENEETKFKEVPISIVLDLEQNELPSSERIHRL